MPETAAPSQSFVSRISLVGRSAGLVKNLRGFRKQHHTVPDAINATTTAFLAKICAGELAEEAEGFFQRSRTVFAYKRADLTLEASGPVAVLSSRDFTFEVSYALDKATPGGYAVTRTLRQLGRGDESMRPAFDELFAALFTGIVFELTGGVKVEAVIDAIEALDDGDGLAVSYPSDCRHCIIRVADVPAEVICDGMTLAMQFPRAGSPTELMEAFRAMRSAFVLTKDRVLAGLL